MAQAEIIRMLEKENVELKERLKSMEAQLSRLTDAVVQGLLLHKRLDLKLFMETKMKLKLLIVPGRGRGDLRKFLWELSHIS